jgi:hypothetical protein
MNKLMRVVLLIWMFAVCSVMAQQQDFGTLIFNHQITIGMSFGNVQAAWGRPKKVDRSVYESGVKEYWFFDNGSMVVFENGRVVSFHSF